MKAVKMFVGMMLCLVVLAGQAQAVSVPVVLDFTNILPEDLDAYGSSKGVTFDGSWTMDIDPDEGENWLTKFIGFSRKDTASTVGISFTPSSAVLNSFDYMASGEVTMFWTPLAGITDSVVLSNGIHESFDFGSLSTALLSSISFNVSKGSYLALDNVAFTPTPLPGAALFFGAGLLGLVGLRRRQTT